MRVFFFWEVWDWDPIPKLFNDSLGVVHLNLSDLKDGETVSIAPPTSKKGYLELKLTYTAL